MTGRRSFERALAGAALGAALSQGGLAAAAGLTPEPADVRAMAVSVVAARRHCFTDLVLATGTFAAKVEASVRADRDGMLVGEVVVDPGDTVAADQVLARLTAPDGAPPQAATVKAPIAGTVVSVAAPVGSYASPSAPDPMFRIVGTEGIEFRAEVLASRLPRLKVGMPATVSVPGLGSVSGQVASIGTGLDAMSQSGIVAIAVTDPRLRIGTYGSVAIDAGQDCGLVVPLSALLSGPQGTLVGVVRDDRVEMRHVEVGLLDGGSAEIRKGLADNDKVVARAGAFLREGDRVRSVTVDPALAERP